MNGRDFEERYGESVSDYRTGMILDRAHETGDAVTYINDGYYSTVETPHGTSKNWTENWTLQVGGLIPVDLGKTNAGEKLLYNLREIYRDYRYLSEPGRTMFELNETVDLSTQLSGAMDRGSMGSAMSGNRNIAGRSVRITILRKNDNDGRYLSGGPNYFSGNKPHFPDAIVIGNRVEFYMKIDPSITFTISVPKNQEAINAAKIHLKNMARFIYDLPTPGFKLSTPDPYE